MRYFFIYFIFLFYLFYFFLFKKNENEITKGWAIKS